mmetsp:Transcript_9448/g.15451  ORF Transcript_9448/g.15451 Transcript_9448/m.15451 type:complete len:347 (+) Transcript_9448:19-1059(+)
MSDSNAFFTIPGLDVSIRLSYLSLILLVFQNVLLVMSMKYSKVHKSEDGRAYLSSTAVTMAELVKFVSAMLLELFFETPANESFVAKMRSEFFNFDTVKLAVPGILYCIQNNLLFVAVTNLPVPIYQVSAQAKILTTAMFSVILLGKRISKLQVFSLFILTGGVGIVQVANSGDKNTDADGLNPMVGLAAIGAACLTSGFAGVYFEKILKHGRKVTLYIRNVQLSFFGVTIGLLTVLANDYNAVMDDGFFQGYTNWTIVVILTQACGGLLVAVVMRYADNILKGFATSVSIIVASTISVFLFSTPLSGMFLCGASLVMAAVYIYGKYPAPQPEKYSQLPQRTPTSA